jgi:hypothetical protein
MVSKQNKAEEDPSFITYLLCRILQITPMEWFPEFRVRKEPMSVMA